MPVRAHNASDYLKTPEDIAEYLNAVIEEMDDDPRLLMIAFRNVSPLRRAACPSSRRRPTWTALLSPGPCQAAGIPGWIRSRKCPLLAA